MEKKLVSIAIATYNGEKYLRKQLESIYNQSYKNIEVIVCDDCSTDKTIEILREYEKKYGLKIFINEFNLGYVKNFEKAISLCNGNYIALSDQDDIWLEEKIEILIKEIGNNLLIHSDCELIDDNDNIIQKSWKKEIFSHQCYEDFLFSNVVTGCTILFKRELLKSALPFPDGLAYHDWYIAILAAKQNKIKYLNKSLIKYRQHSSQDTGAISPSRWRGILFDKFLRILGKKVYREVAIEKQLKNLKSLKSSLPENKALDDVIEYFSNYIDSVWHFKMFFIGIKYSKNAYPRRNILYIRNFINDILR